MTVELMRLFALKWTKSGKDGAAEDFALFSSGR
jgi:hypothetical protein